MDRLTRYSIGGCDIRASDNGNWCESFDVEKLEAELTGLKDGAFQAHEQHDADQAEIARLTAELAQVKADLRTVCDGWNLYVDTNGATRNNEAWGIIRRTLNEKEKGK